MNSFFVFEPTGGTTLFSPLHLMWLWNTLFLCIWSGYMARRGHCAARAAALLLLLAEFFRVLTLFICGRLDTGFLPFHLCGAAVYVCLFHEAQCGQLAGELIYSTLAPGALTALLFPDWLHYPAGSFLFLSSFGIHMLICAYSAAMLCSGLFHPSPQRLPLCSFILSLYGLAVYGMDRLLRVNYLFLLFPAADSPLEWAAAVLPWHGLLYFPALALVWGALYSHPVLRLIQKGVPDPARLR